MRGAVLGLARWIAALALAACAAAPEEGPTASLDVEFRGTSRPSFRLRRIIEDLLIDFERAPDAEAPLFDAALDLQDHFVADGRPEARVTYRLQREPSLLVVFEIDEGPEVTVERVRFTGNVSISSDDLLALWTRTNAGGLGLGDPLYVHAGLEVLQFSIRALYDSRGYLDTKVDGPSVERPPGSNRVTVDYRIDEGARYRFGHIDVDAGLPLDLAALGTAELPGRTFDRAAAAALPLRARDALLRTGYPEPRLDFDLEVDGAAHVVNLKLHGDAGVRAHVASVKIEGNELTHEHVITRHVRFEPGQMFDGHAVEQTLGALYRTGLFRRVEIERKATDTSGEQVDMTVKVEEVDTHDVDLLLGYGSYESVRAGLFWTNRNLFGLGQRLTAGVRASTKGESANVTWLEPYVFGSDTSLTIGTFVREREEPAFVDVSRGFDTALARQLWGPVRGRLGYSLQSRDGSDIDPTVATPEEATYEIGSVFTELLIEQRDSPLYPNAGNRQNLKFEHAGVGGNTNFDRLTWASSWYHSLATNVVIGLSVRGGVIWPEGDEVIPPQERFYNGGEASVRSFEESELGPLSSNGTPIGGNFFNTFNLELRLPLVATLHAALFADAGNLGVDASDFTLEELRYAIGAGLRLVLPIGPIRLDYARNPNPRSFEENDQLHFSVGLPF